MKPIEVGCLVMVINPDLLNFGKVSRVVNVAFSSLDAHYKDFVVDLGDELWESEACQAGVKHWVLDKLGLVEGDFVNGVRKISGPASGDVPFIESSLMRIDGDVDEESECDEVSRVKDTVCWS